MTHIERTLLVYENCEWECMSAARGGVYVDCMNTQLHAVIMTSIVRILYASVRLLQLYSPVHRTGADSQTSLQGCQPLFGVR